MKTQHPVSLGIDLGGSFLKAGLVTDARVVRSESLPSRVDLGPRDTLARVAKIVRELCPEINGATPVGLGMPGLIRDGVLIASYNFPGWRDVPVQEILQQDLGTAVELSMDAEAIAAGEFWAGGHHPRRNLFVFTLGTGVGAAAVLDGEVYAGAGGFLLVNRPESSRDFGPFSLLEDLISAPAIIRQAGEDRGVIAQSANEELTVEQVCDAARQGDFWAKGLWERIGAYLGWACVNVAHLFLLERVVVGGGVSRAGDLLLDPARRFFKLHASPAISETCDIVASALGDEAGILGAALGAVNARGKN